MLKTLAWVGGILLIGLMLVAFLFPGQRRSRAAALRVMCKNNLNQIGIALDNYRVDHWTFPPAYTVDAEGKKLHSWRTLILPYMDQKALYDKIDLSKPWNDPVNAAARKTPLTCYACPSSTASPNLTSYVAMVGDDFAFPPKGPRRMNEFVDGLNETVLVMEIPAQDAFEWMEPRDGDEATFMAFSPESKKSHRSGIQVILGNGTPMFLSDSLPAEKRRALLTVSAKDDVGEF
jgi:hypothetical protein